MIGPTCPKCRRVHTAGSVTAVGRFRPDGPVGYRTGGRLYPTRAAAEAALCRSLTVSGPDPGPAVAVASSGGDHPITSSQI